MKSTLVIAILLTAATCAPAEDKKKDATTAATPAPAIPKDATLNPDGRTYSYTDKQGKKWNYIRTPFGITRVAATDKPAAAPPDTGGIKVIDKGDTVRFERPSPFGPIGWEKKKSELTENERRIFDAWKADANKAQTQRDEKTR